MTFYRDEQYTPADRLLTDLEEEGEPKIYTKALTINPASGTYNTTFDKEFIMTFLLLTGTVTAAGVLYFEIKINGVSFGRWRMYSIVTGNNESFFHRLYIPNIKIKLGDSASIITSAIAATGDLSCLAGGYSL